MFGLVVCRVIMSSISCLRMRLCRPALARRPYATRGTYPGSRCRHEQVRTSADVPAMSYQGDDANDYLSARFQAYILCFACLFAVQPIASRRPRVQPSGATREEQNGWINK